MMKQLVLLALMLCFAVPARTEEPVPLTPDFTAVVVKGGGLWPQLHPAPDGALLAFGYNAPAHTTLPGDVDCWASTDGASWKTHRASSWQVHYLP